MNGSRNGIRGIRREYYVNFCNGTNLKIYYLCAVLTPDLHEIGTEIMPRRFRLSNKNYR